MVRLAEMVDEISRRYKRDGKEDVKQTVTRSKPRATGRKVTFDLVPVTFCVKPCGSEITCADVVEPKTSGVEDETASVPEMLMSTVDEQPVEKEVSDDFVCPPEFSAGGVALNNQVLDNVEEDADVIVKSDLPCDDVMKMISALCDQGDVKDMVKPEGVHEAVCSRVESAVVKVQRIVQPDIQIGSKDVATVVNDEYSVVADIVSAVSEAANCGDEVHRLRSSGASCSLAVADVPMIAEDVTDVLVKRLVVNPVSRVPMVEAVVSESSEKSGVKVAAAEFVDQFESWSSGDDHGGVELRPCFGAEVFWSLPGRPPPHGRI